MEEELGKLTYVAIAPAEVQPRRAEKLREEDERRLSVKHLLQAVFGAHGEDDRCTSLPRFVLVFPDLPRRVGAEEHQRTFLWSVHARGGGECGKNHKRKRCCYIVCIGSIEFHTR